jgi:K+-transporting ATPase ATPase A chain
MGAKEYAGAFLLFSLVSTLLVYVILRTQMFFLWYDKSVLTTPITPDLAFNTAVSFMTTTTWQAYSGENTMSYWTQITAFVGQNFLAGAAGLAVGMAFIRGFAERQQRQFLGNYWFDLVRSLLWILLPASIVGSIFLVWQGVPMDFHHYTDALSLEGAHQTIAQGPVAALEFIENLGTNGGGFFAANGAHPFENPTPLTNFVEMLAIVVIPAALTNTFGRYVGSLRQGWTLFWMMTFLFAAGYILAVIPEQHGNHLMEGAGLITQGHHQIAGGNMEGKEVRFGVASSVLTTVVTSNTATGSTNSMLDSYLPLSGMIPMVNMLLGEIVYGGLGTGLYSIVMVALIAVFVAGLMVGRTPEYLGRTIDADKMKLVILFTLASPAAILIPTAIAVVIPAGLAGLTTNTGAHGFSEILYAYASCFANNGQSFGGLNANLPFYNITTTIAMMVGRFGLAIPALFLAEKFAFSRRHPSSRGSMPTDSLQFGMLLVGVALIVVGLTYFPAIALGPIVEHSMGVR